MMREEYEAAVIALDEAMRVAESYGYANETANFLAAVIGQHAMACLKAWLGEMGKPAQDGSPQAGKNKGVTDVQYTE